MSTSQIERGSETMTAKSTQGPENRGDQALGEVLASFGGDKSELIPILQRTQETLGYLPEEALRRIASFARVPESTVFGVATFYAQFRFTPVGRNLIKPCRGTGCYVKGAPRLLDEVEKLLGIKDGQTTPDLEYTLETVACFGSCALAPVVVVNGKVHGSMTPEKVRALLRAMDETRSKPDNDGLDPDIREGG
jgi:NADH-quinone oxidoreductase subunit E